MSALILGFVLSATQCSQTITVEVLSPAQYEQQQRDEAARTQEVDTQAGQTDIVNCSETLCVASSV
jgi:hypothetical protein